MKRKALGKGLDVLLPQQSSLSSLLSVEIDVIQPNPMQPRIEFESGKLDELVASIREKGILQPIVLRRADSGYEIVAGERRWRAAQKAGLHRIPAIVQDVSDQEMVELALIENIQRDDLSAVEEARAYEVMSKQFGLTQEEIARRVGRSRSAVTNTLRLLTLPKMIQGMIVKGSLSMGHARALIPLPPSEQQLLAVKIVEKDLSVRETERLVRRFLEPKPKSKSNPGKDPNVAAAERELEERWKTRVEILQKGTKGKVVFYFNSEEELDRLYEEFLGN
jgi:ParB family chromosome partitioning protein